MTGLERNSDIVYALLHFLELELTALLDSLHPMHLF